MASSNSVFNYTNKGLVISSIISIFIMNCLLIFKTVRKGGFMYNPKSLTLISLAIGDIFLALLSLVVVARSVFEEYSLIDCSIKRAAAVHMLYLIHFVYGVGLIVLAVELVYRYKRQPPVRKSMNDIVEAVVCSAMPWILGLIIVLPLTLESWNDSRQCMLVLSTKRFSVMYGVSVLLPASLAVIVCFIVMFIKLVPVQYTCLTVQYKSTTPGVIFARHNTTNGPQQYQMSSVSETQQYTVSGLSSTQQTSTEPSATYYNRSDHHNLHSGSQEIISTSTHCLPPQIPAQPQQSPQNLAQPNLPILYPVQSYLPLQQTVLSPVTALTPIYLAQPQNTSPACPDPGREKKLLLMVSIIYFVCVVPWAAYELREREMIGGEQTWINILGFFFFWLSVFRSLITPTIWFGFTRNND